MSRILRLVVIALMLTLTSMILDISPVGAKWVRLGDSAHVVDLKICKDGIEISLALSFSSTSSPDITFGEVHYQVKVYQYNKSGEVQLVSEAPISISKQSTPLKGMPDGNNNYTLQTYFYGPTVQIFWPVNTDLTVGSVVNVVAVREDGNNIRLSHEHGSPSEVENCLLIGPNFTDSRADTYHPWQSVAVYCEDDMVKVYGIDANANGYFAFAATQADIDKLGIPTENTLLASVPSTFGGNIDLYKLKDTGELQINAPGIPPDTWKEYVFTWGGCS